MLNNIQNETSLLMSTIFTNRSSLYQVVKRKEAIHKGQPLILFIYPL